jgi:hypothetical protein
MEMVGKQFSPLMEMVGKQFSPLMETVLLQQPSTDRDR